MKILALVLSPWWQRVCDMCTPCPCDPGGVARNSAASPQNTKLHPGQCKQLRPLLLYIPRAC